MIIAGFVAGFLLGRAGSLLLYQGTWYNGKARRFHAWGALATFLRRPWPWLLHLPILALGLGLDWQDMPTLRLYAWVAGGVLSLATIGRWGALDLGRFFLFDRCLIAFLWLGLWASPAFLYPLLLTCCCLQYSVSGWPLQPGYSNLLGYEFMRSSLCQVLAALLVQEGLGRCGMVPSGGAWGVTRPEAQAFALVLCGQAAGYVQQAVAKCALGKHWYSWILENRLQCLPVNAYLRGWGKSWAREAWVLRLADWISRWRVLLCGLAWMIEASWLGMLADPRMAMGVLIATAVFHFAVWSLTGLAGYHYLASHLLMLGVAASPLGAEVFTTEHALIGCGCLVGISIWVLLLRRRLFRAYLRNADAGGWARLADPADHLMAWWDGPYMRLYSYSVTTVSGRRWHFPVTGFSPYDTFLTDIHTHLMILGKDWDLDPDLASDRAIARVGVWGLTVSLEDRDKLYRMMDRGRDASGPDLQGLSSGQSPAAQLAPKRGAASPESRAFLDGIRVSAAGSPLRTFFHGLNRFHMHRWFRILMLWPHFPGEDRVPDWSPRAADDLPVYDVSEPVVEVACHCLKTFYRGDSIETLDEKVFARIPIQVGHWHPEAEQGDAGAGQVKVEAGQGRAEAEQGGTMIRRHSAAGSQ